MSRVRLGDAPLLARAIWSELTRDNVDVMAGGVAFFATLSLFPATVALVLVYGLFADPAGLERQLGWLAQSLVPLARDVLTDSLRVAGTNRTTIGFGALGALALGIYGASRATNAVLLAIQAAFDDDEQRGFFAQLRLNLTLTAAALGGLGMLLVPFAAAPDLLSRLGFGEGAVRAIVSLRWPLLWFGFFAALSILYRWAPRKSARVERVWPGALAATFVWTLVSFGFSFYAAKLGGYDGTYGPAAAFAIFMTWLYLTSYVVIAGAELNAELARLLRRSPARAGEPTATPPPDAPVGPGTLADPGPG